MRIEINQDQLEIILDSLCHYAACVDDNIFTTKYSGRIDDINHVYFHMGQYIGEDE